MDGLDTAVWAEIEARAMKEWAQAMVDMSAWVTVELATMATGWAWEEELLLYALDSSGQPVPNLSQVEYLREHLQGHQSFSDVAQLLESYCCGGRYPAVRPVTQSLWGRPFCVQGQLPVPQALKLNPKSLSYSSSQSLALWRGRRVKARILLRMSLVFAFHASSSMPGLWRAAIGSSLDLCREWNIILPSLCVYHIHTTPFPFDVVLSASRKLVSPPPNRLVFRIAVAEASVAEWKYRVPILFRPRDVMQHALWFVTAPPVPELEKHPKYSFDDASVSVIVEDPTRFDVHWSLLRRDSKFFEGLLTGAGTFYVPESKIQEFESLLVFLYDGANTTAPARMIQITKLYGVEKWLDPACVALTERGEVISNEEAEMVGMRDLLTTVKAREARLKNTIRRLSKSGAVEGDSLDASQSGVEEGSTSELALKESLLPTPWMLPLPYSRASSPPSPSFSPAITPSPSVPGAKHSAAPSPPYSSSVASLEGVVGGSTPPSKSPLLAPVLTPHYEVPSYSPSPWLFSVTTRHPSLLPVPGLCFPMIHSIF
ncbi:hypothetical protein V5O48_006123 [Marasmius crinis-equi]|uniref:BTB domain-containing protein n=1 Tax=Marasmius crinis-equi TaxID=585013 RepID=A0ABR3FKR8_9AGAR